MPTERLVPKFLTKEVAERAVSGVLSMVMGNTFFILKRQQCHIVVLVPSMEDARAKDYPAWPNYPIEPAVLYEHSKGKFEWEHPYDDIARCKALQLWHERNDDRTDCMPHLLFPGDTALSS